MDMLFCGYLPEVWFYERTLDVDALKAGVQDLLDQVPYIAGRIHTTVRRFLLNRQCTTTGVSNIVWG